MNKLISVIIPAFNVEKYIKDCLDCVHSQTYKNIEIIVINDGSTDNTSKICNEYLSKEKRMKLIETKNFGAAFARNTGVKNSVGEYVAFIDADDLVTKDYIEFLNNITIKYHADITISGYQKVFNNNNDLIKYVEKDGALKLYTSAEAIEDLLYRKVMTNSPCKFIKREILVHIPFKEGQLYEDLGVVYKWFDYATTIAYHSSKRYFYTQRLYSSMHSTFNINKWDLMIITYEMKEYVLNKYKDLGNAIDNRTFISSLQMLRYLPDKVEYQEYFNEIKALIKKLRIAILLDRKSKLSTKIMAMTAFLNIKFLRKIGILYDILIMRFHIKLKY